MKACSATYFCASRWLDRNETSILNLHVWESWMSVSSFPLCRWGKIMLRLKNHWTDFKINSMPDWKPVQVVPCEIRYVIESGATGHNTSSHIDQWLGTLPWELYHGPDKRPEWQQMFCVHSGPMPGPATFKRIIISDVAQASSINLCSKMI